MYCNSCGVQIVPQGASFCWNCGAARQQFGAGAAPQAGVPTVQSGWEKCEIRHMHVLDTVVPSLKAHVSFVAEAAGPTGAYTAATSSSFTLNPAFSSPDLAPKADDRAAKQALDGLITKLTQSGWESIGDGDSWFNRQFRRRVA